MDIYSQMPQSSTTESEHGADTPPLRVPLGDAINSATRSIHSKLNRMVLLRLPLAVPPCTDNPSLYITGLLHLAPVYITFENLWRSLLPTDEDLALPPPCLTNIASLLDGHASPARQPPTLHSPSLPSSPTTPAHIITVLSDVHIPELQRSDRLRADIAALTGWPADMVDEQLREVANTAHLAAFIRHIEASVARHPHVLLAYAWVLYMALFAGGRFIRASLESAGDNFWKRRPDSIRPTMMPCATSSPDRRASVEKPLSPPMSPPMPAECADHRERNRAAACGCQGRGYPLSFFHFAPLVSASTSSSPPTLRRDGEDLKAVFKSRLAAADEQLSDRERGHVVREAECVFENIIKLASQLDDVCGGDEEEDIEGMEDEDFSRNSPLARLMTARAGKMRDSIALSKTRAEKVAAKAGKSAAGKADPREASTSANDGDYNEKDRREISIDDTTPGNSSGYSSSLSTISDFQGHIADPLSKERERLSEHPHEEREPILRKTRSVVRFGAKDETIPEACCEQARGGEPQDDNSYEEGEEASPAPLPTPTKIPGAMGLDGATDSKLMMDMEPISRRRKGRSSGAGLAQRIPRPPPLTKETQGSQLLLVAACVALAVGYMYFRGLGLSIVL